jgi:hypothetical protein
MFAAGVLAVCARCVVRRAAIPGSTFAMSSEAHMHPDALTAIDEAIMVARQLRDRSRAGEDVQELWGQLLHRLGVAKLGVAELNEQLAAARRIQP